jgi:hypothetical protein
VSSSLHFIAFPFLNYSVTTLCIRMSIPYAGTFVAIWWITCFCIIFLPIGFVMLCLGAICEGCHKNGCGSHMDWCMDESGSIALIVVGGVLMLSSCCTILCATLFGICYFVTD